MSVPCGAMFVPQCIGVLWFLILKSRYVALDSVDNSNDCKKWLVDLTIVSVWYSSVVLL